MGSSRFNSEITEAKYEPSTTRCTPTFRPQDREQKPPLQRKPHGKYLEDDINKLFESINLRSSKSLDLSDWPRNPSKKPIWASGPHSPAIGFSEPVSLKQALRGMCISQAAEMAAAKRLSMPASPRVSETGKLSNLCRPEHGKFVRANEDLGSCLSLGYDSKSGGKSLNCGSRVEREYAMCSQELNQSSRSLQSGVVINEKKTTNVRSDTSGRNSEADKSSSNDVLKLEKKVSSLNKVSGPNKVASKVAPKVRMKPKLQIVPSSNSVKSSKVVKSTRRTSLTAKPVVKNKALIVNKPKKVKISTIRSLERPHGGKNESRGQNPTLLICQNCQCSMENTNKELIKDPPITDTTSKSAEKVDFSQSSKSSNCDFSSSTTSLSEDSCLNGPIFGNRPHMSKDKKWESINRTRLQYGFLGLNHFNLLRKLGSGDIGTVYLAELIGTNCVFAIKVMDNEFLAVRKKTGRAQTEREILRMLDHPFLPVLYAQFTSDNLSCLVLEFCSGGDLHVLRQKQPGRYFHEQAARFYAAEVLLALEYLHMLGIVYRDLKPENILVREDGHIMLTDFDLSLRCSVKPTLVKSSGLSLDPARISGPCAGSNCIDPFCAGPSCQVSCFGPALHSTAARARARKLKADAAARARDRALPQLVAEPNDARSNSFVGTHEYLAPEIIKGDGHGSAVDWWTFGVLLYELLYGRTPFKGACNEETLANVVLKGLRFPESPMVSSQARDLIRGLLVKDPENRMGTETGAAEIKKHPFFDGLNWALIRCGAPPKLVEVCDGGGGELEKGKGHMGCIGNGGDSEFELF